MVPEPGDWQLQCRELKQRGSYLLQSGLWTDCSFLVGTEPHQVSVPGHKLILSIASPVFEAMFYGSLAETSMQPIPIKDVLPEAFKALLEYIYTDKINISCVTNACGLYYGAKKYMLPHLMKKCLRYIWASLCPKNVCYLYEFAKMFELRVLLKTCEQIIERNASEVLKDSSFEELEPSTVLEVFSLRLRVRSEVELFEAADRRARLFAAGDDVTIRSLIEKIRFLTLTPQQFAEGPAKSPLLTKDESFAILTNLATSNSHLPLPEGFSACRVPRSLRAGPVEEMSMELNEECWRHVLDYVPVLDMIKSERVSRGWQNVVLGYLTNVRIGIDYTLFRYLQDVRRLKLTSQTLPRMDSPSFELWCRKLGVSVAFTCCASEKRIKTLPELCPNLEAVTFVELTENVLQKHTAGAFKRLEQLYFCSCNVSDSCIAKFVSSNKVKRLLIRDNEQLTGECLLNIESTKLESLVLADCEALKLSHLSSAVKRFKKLVELELQFVPDEIYENIHLLLPNTPNLQVLIVDDKDLELKNFFGAVCKLSRLEFLYSSFKVTDMDIEALVRSCKYLRVLLLYACHGVTGRGLRTACELAGARFTKLSVSYNSTLTNNDVAACIRACPKLESLDVSGCNLTRELLPLAAAARRAAAGTRLLLNLHIADIHNDLRTSQKEHEELIIYSSNCLSDNMLLRL